MMAGLNLFFAKMSVGFRLLSSLPNFDDIIPSGLETKDPVLPSVAPGGTESILSSASGSASSAVSSAADIESAVSSAAAGQAGGINVPAGILIALAVLLLVLVGVIVWLSLTKPPVKNTRKNKPPRKGDEKAQAPEQPGDFGTTVSLAEPAAAAVKAAGPVTVQVGKVHEQGARSGQQDSFAVSDLSLYDTHGLLAVVADGMGGLSDGDKVSRAAVQAAMDAFVMYQGQGTPEQLLLLLLQRAVESVNRLLGPDGYRRSGSTIVMGLIKQNTFYYLSVGDSRISLLRDGELYQLNREHIYRNDLAVKAVNREIGLGDVYRDPKGSGLTSFLGMGSLAMVDLPAEGMRIHPGDRFILMSDGIYNALTREEMIAALSVPDTAASAEALRAAVAGKGYSNQDNYTGVLLTCQSGGYGLNERKVEEDLPAVPAVAVEEIPKTEDLPG